MSTQIIHGESMQNVNVVLLGHLVGWEKVDPRFSLNSL